MVEQGRKLRFTEHQQERVASRYQQYFNPQLQPTVVGQGGGETGQVAPKERQYGQQIDQQAAIVKRSIDRLKTEDNVRATTKTADSDGRAKQSEHPRNVY